MKDYMELIRKSDEVLLFIGNYDHYILKSRLFERDLPSCVEGYFNEVHSKDVLILSYRMLKKEGFNHIDELLKDLTPLEFGYSDIIINKSVE